MKKKIITGLLVAIIAISCGANNVEIEGNKVVKSGDAYYLYYNKTIIKLDSNTYLTKDKQVSDYSKKSFFENGDADLLSALKAYFPHGFNGVVEGDAPAEFIEMPLISFGDKKIINSIALAEDLSSRNPELLISQDDTKEEKEVVEENNNEVNLTGKKLTVLNANGIAGYAKKIGEELKNKLGIEYTSTNNSKSEVFSYIANKNLSSAELEKLIETTGLKYVKISNDTNLDSNSDVVLITGNDAQVKFDIEVISKSGDQNIAKLLGEYKVATKKDSKYNNEDIADDVVILYNPNDIYIAKRLQKLIEKSTLKEDISLTDKIVITTK